MIAQMKTMLRDYVPQYVILVYGTYTIVWIILCVIFVRVAEALFQRLWVTGVFATRVVRAGYYGDVRQQRIYGWVVTYLSSLWFPPNCRASPTLPVVYWPNYKPPAED